MVREVREVTSQTDRLHAREPTRKGALGRSRIEMVSGAIRAVEEKQCEQLRTLQDAQAAGSSGGGSCKPKGPGAGMKLETLAISTAHGAEQKAPRERGVGDFDPLPGTSVARMEAFWKTTVMPLLERGFDTIMRSPRLSPQQKATLLPQAAAQKVLRTGLESIAKEFGGGRGGAGEDSDSTPPGSKKNNRLAHLLALRLGHALNDRFWNFTAAGRGGNKNHTLSRACALALAKGKLEDFTKTNPQEHDLSATTARILGVQLPPLPPTEDPEGGHSSGSIFGKTTFGSGGGTSAPTQATAESGVANLVTRVSLPPMNLRGNTYSGGSRTLVAPANEMEFLWDEGDVGSELASRLVIPTFYRATVSLYFDSEKRRWQLGLKDMEWQDTLVSDHSDDTETGEAQAEGGKIRRGVFRPQEPDRKKRQLSVLLPRQKADNETQDAEETTNWSEKQLRAHLRANHQERTLRSTVEIPFFDPQRFFLRDHVLLSDSTSQEGSSFYDYNAFETSRLKDGDESSRLRSFATESSSSADLLDILRECFTFGSCDEDRLPPRTATAEAEQSEQDPRPQEGTPTTTNKNKFLAHLARLLEELSSSVIREDEGVLVRQRVQEEFSRVLPLLVEHAAGDYVLRDPELAEELKPLPESREVSLLESEEAGSCKSKFDFHVRFGVAVVADMATPFTPKLPEVFYRGVLLPSTPATPFSPSTPSSSTTTLLDRVKLFVEKSPIQAVRQIDENTLKTPTEVWRQGLGLPPVHSEQLAKSLLAVVWQYYFLALNNRDPVRGLSTMIARDEELLQVQEHRWKTLLELFALGPPFALVVGKRERGVRWDNDFRRATWTDADGKEHAGEKVSFVVNVWENLRLLYLDEVGKKGWYTYLQQDKYRSQLST